MGVWGYGCMGVWEQNDECRIAKRGRGFVSSKKLSGEGGENGVWRAPVGFAVGLIGFWWLCFVVERCTDGAGVANDR